MDNKPEEIIVSPEEANAEAEAQAEVKDDELRTKLAEEMGIDPDDEAELLDKVVAREKANREKLSGAIKQKIKYRDLAKGKGTSTEKPKGDETSKDGDNPKPLTQEDVDRQVQERLDNRDLEDMDLPDDIKTEVKDLAKLKGISVKEAAKQPYIKDRIERAKKEAEVEAATPKRKNKGSGVSGYDSSKAPDPADFDLSDPEGQKNWKEAKDSHRKYLESHK